MEVRDVVAVWPLGGDAVVVVPGVLRPRRAFGDCGAGDGGCSALGHAWLALLERVVGPVDMRVPVEEEDRTSERGRVSRDVVDEWLVSSEVGNVVAVAVPSVCLLGDHD